MERKCSTLILNDNLTIPSMLSNMTIVQIDAKKIPIIYQAIVRNVRRIVKCRVQ